MIIIPPYYFEANDISKIIIFIVLVVHTIITYFFDITNKQRITFDEILISNKHKYDRIAYILCFISLILTFYALFTVGTKFIFKHDYSGALREAGIPMIWLHYPAALTILYATLTKNRNLFILSFIPLFVYGYMGYRAELVLALIGSMIIYSYNSKFFSSKSIKIGLLTFIIFIIFAFYKVTYYDIKNEDVDVFEKFQNTSDHFNENEYIKKILFYNEFGQIASNLSLSTDANLGKHYDLSIVIFGSIPFVKKFTQISEEDVRFNRLIEKYANPGFSYGLGGSIWAEAYAAFNLFGVILFVFFLSFIISFLNKYFVYSNIILVFSPLFLSYVSFYIHRSELTLFFAHIKNLIFLLLLAYTILIIYYLFIFLLFDKK